MRTYVHTDLLLVARAAHERRDWRTSYEAFERAGEVESLHPDDLDALAFAAWRLGHVKQASRAAERVFGHLTRTDPVAAAMKANELALGWLVRGDVNIAQGWMDRARRLLAGAPEGPAHGYLLYLDAAVAAVSQDLDALAVHVSALRDLGRRLDARAVTALSLIAGGVEAIMHARTADGYALIDEAIPALLADQVPIEWAGDIYCMVLHHCHRLADLPRMRAWTQSMEQWCGLSGALPYGGVCDVHRLQLRTATDDYGDLQTRLSSASRALEGVNIRAAAEGFYQLGEVSRLLGDNEGALAAFAKARSLGMDPQPGEALLCCRQGDSQAAWTAIRVALAGADRLARIRLLRAAVEIALGRDNLGEAENYCRELESGAAAFNTPGFRGWAAQARGAVHIRRGEFADALAAFRSALREHRTQRSGYETAEVYEWMALAHRGLGEHAAAEADAATADSIYAQLGLSTRTAAVAWAHANNLLP